VCVLRQVSGGVSESTVSPVRRRVLHRDSQELWSSVHGPHLVAGPSRAQRRLRAVVAGSHHDGTDAMQCVRAELHNDWVPCRTRHQRRRMVNPSNAVVVNVSTPALLRRKMLRIGSRPSDHYFCSVCLSVCLFVCAEFFSAVFDPIWIKLGHMLHVRV